MRYLVIRTENLTKFFGHHMAVEDICLEVEPGEVYGFLGPDGAGKSTTLRMLLDFVRPTHGRALVLGLEAHRQSAAIRRQVGYLPGSLLIGGRQTGLELLRTLGMLRGNLDLPYITELAGRFALNLNTPIAALNRTDQSKLGLVQAFAHHPELLILDEPTRGLDSAAQETVYDLISAARAEGRAVLLASSSLREMERACDRVAVLHHGHVIAVERGVQLRARAMRNVEMRFAAPVSAEIFSGLNNLDNLRLDDNKLRCTVHGDPDALIKLASQHRVTDFICQQPSLEEAFRVYYGVQDLAA